MFDTYSAAAAPQIADAPVVEFRQYTLRPGARDTLVKIFEEHFVESQEAVGMRVGGLFGDRADPDRFVWMRAFASMDARCEALSAFYGGPVWAEHGPAANATMIDSDDVLLLRPTTPARPPLPPARSRVPVEAANESALDEWVLFAAYPHEPGHGLCDWFAAEAAPVLETALKTRVATWRTEPAPNSYPALPVRSDHTVVWTATFVDAGACAAALARLEASEAWLDVRSRVDAAVTAPEIRQLAPTARSQHPGVTPPSPPSLE